MKYLLDTNILIYILKKPNKKLLDKFTSIPSPSILIPSIVLAELEYGFQNSKDYAQSKKQFEVFLRLFHLAPFDKKCAEEYGKIVARLKRENRLIGNMDMLIAATAKANDMILVTHNVREFARVPGLRVEDWVEECEFDK